MLSNQFNFWFDKKLEGKSWFSGVKTCLLWRQEIIARLVEFDAGLILKHLANKNEPKIEQTFKPNMSLRKVFVCNALCVWREGSVVVKTPINTPNHKFGNRKKQIIVKLKKRSVQKLKSRWPD